jgi:hypothetical protein
MYVRIWPAKWWCCNILIASGSMLDPACTVPNVACMLLKTVAFHYATCYLFPAHRCVKGYIQLGYRPHITVYIYGWVTGNRYFLPFNRTVYLVSKNKALPSRFCRLRYQSSSNIFYYRKYWYKFTRNKSGRKTNLLSYCLDFLLRISIILFRFICLKNLLLEYKFSRAYMFSRSDIT